MATSGSTDFSVTEQNIITDALQEIGVVALGETIPASYYDKCRRYLNMLVKFYQTQADLWPTKDVTATLTAGTPSYNIGSSQTINTPQPLRLISARRKDTSNNEIPVRTVSRQEYMAMPVKSTQGPVNIVYYDKQLSPGKIYVWPTGTTGNLTLILTVTRPLEDFDATGDTPDFPNEWYLCLVKNLAVILGPSFNRVITEDLARQAAGLQTEMLGWDEEAQSIYIQPEIQ